LQDCLHPLPLSSKHACLHQSSHPRGSTSGDDRLSWVIFRKVCGSGKGCRSDEIIRLPACGKEPPRRYCKAPTSRNFRHSVPSYRTDLEFIPKSTRKIAAFYTSKQGTKPPTRLHHKRHSIFPQIPIEVGLSTRSQWLVASVHQGHKTVAYLSRPQAQTPEQRKRNQKFAKDQSAKRGKPASEIKKKQDFKSPISPIWLGMSSYKNGWNNGCMLTETALLGFVVFGGLIFELLSRIFFR
jgi:hypothetical protein